MRPRRWFAIYFGTVFFLLHVAVGLLRGPIAVQDPGIGWHLATGRLILETGAVPRADPFSFTSAGHPWISYYWLADVASALLQRVGGLPAVAAAWMLVYALIPFVLYRTSIRAGATPLAAVPAVLLAYVVLLSHAVARPHAVTYLFFALVVQKIRDVERGQATSLWTLPLLAVLWANMHGGFLAGVAAGGLGAAAIGGRWLVHGDPRDARGARVLATLCVAMALATLINPYGWRLPVYAMEHLARPSTGYMVEFRPPDFGDGGAAVRAFEALVLALLGVAALRLASPSVVDVALAIATLHLGLHAARHMNLFAIVAAPLVACGLTAILAAWRPALDVRWRTIAREQEREATWRLHLPLVAVVVMALATAGRSSFPATLDDLRLSRGAADYVSAHPALFERAFNTDELGGALIDRFWPRVHVFVDDRTDVYDEAFLTRDYYTVLYGRSGWEGVLDRWKLVTAIVPVGTACATAMEASPRWRVAYRDQRNAILRRVGADEPAAR